MTPERHAGRATLGWAALLAFIAAIYTVPAHSIPALAELPLAFGPALLAIVATLAAVVFSDRRLHAGGRVGIAVLAFLGVTVTSVAWSIWPRHSTDSAVDAAKYGLGFLLVANLVDGRRRLRSAIVALALLPLVPALGAITSYLRGEHLVEGTRASWVGNFANPNMLAYHLVAALPLVLALRETTRGVARLALAAAAAVLVAGVLLTGSRGGLFGLGAVVLVAASWSLGRGQAAAALAAAALVLVAVYATPGTVWKRAETTLVADEVDASAQGRIDAWRAGMAMAGAHPLGGVGTGAFMLGWPLYAPGDVGPARSPHNSFVQVLAETGIAGLLPYLAALWLGMARAVRRSRGSGPEAVAARGLALALWGFVVCSATGGYAFTWPVWLLLGVAASPALAGAAATADPRLAAAQAR